jgi:hypothetical protein
MKSSRLLLVPVITFAVACGGGSSSDGGGGGGGGGGSTTITTPTQGNNASAASSQSLSLAANSGTSLSNLANFSQVTSQLGSAIRFRSPLADKDARHVALHAAQKKAMGLHGAKLASALQKAKSLAAGQRAQAVYSDSFSCADGGSVSYDVTVQDSGAFSLSMTYQACRENDEQLNGVTTATGTFAQTGGYTFSVTAGDGDGMVEESEDFTAWLFTPGYVDLYAKYTAAVTLSGSGGCADQACSTFNTTLTASGQEVYSDFIDEFTVTYNQLSVVASDTASADGYTGSFTINGGVSESWTDGSDALAVALTFANLTLSSTVTASYYEETADGAVTVNFTPDAYCFEGTFTIDTQVPVRYSFDAGHTTAGQVVINGNVTVVYNADGSVTITVTGQPGASYDSVDEFEAVCEMMDKEPSDSTVDTVNPGDNTTATGSTLLATLSWTGGETSDMDLHLMHYAETAPTYSSTADWHVYFSDMEDGGYAVLDIDDTEGYGPEHITMATLPTGYYMLYVDPWSLDSDPSATVTVTLRIGSDTFQFLAHEFLPSDDADYRVCDLMVESGGAVTILAPDESLASLAPALHAMKMR